MANTAQDWMSSPVVVVDPDTSVSHAITLMRGRNIHSVIVGINEQNPTYGIVTTTDIRDKILVVGRNPNDTSVRQIMSGPIVTGHPDWSLRECSKVMQQHKIHHLPVSDEHGALVGLISVTDIFIAVEETSWEETIETTEQPRAS